MKSPIVTEEKLMEIFRETEKVLVRPIDIYLIGGSAMEVQRYKDATKDIDIAVDPSEGEVLESAMRSIGLQVNSRIRGRPQDSKFENAILVDLFAGQICGRMHLSAGMKKRSVPISLTGKARIHAISIEDIFLLKSLTERERDVDEMLILLRAGLDWHAILEECSEQDGDHIRNPSVIYEAFVVEKLGEIETRHGVQIPWKAAFKKTAEEKMMDHALFSLIGRKGPLTEADIWKELPGMRTLSKRRLGWLRRGGFIDVDESGNYTVAEGSDRV
jgi:hypothetical protein